MIERDIRQAEQLIVRGYKAIKLHTWIKPVSFDPDPKMDVKACPPCARPSARICR